MMDYLQYDLKPITMRRNESLGVIAKLRCYRIKGSDFSQVVNEILEPEDLDSCKDFDRRARLVEL